VNFALSRRDLYLGDLRALVESEAQKGCPSVVVVSYDTTAIDGRLIATSRRVHRKEFCTGGAA
jgi:hypothetical protein